MLELAVDVSGGISPISVSVSVSGNVNTTVAAEIIAGGRRLEVWLVLLMGSVYEEALFVLFEIMVLRLKADLEVDPDHGRRTRSDPGQLAYRRCDFRRGYCVFCAGVRRAPV